MDKFYCEMSINEKRIFEITDWMGKATKGDKC